MRSCIASKIKTAQKSSRSVPERGSSGAVIPLVCNKYAAKFSRAADTLSVAELKYLGACVDTDLAHWSGMEHNH